MPRRYPPKPVTDSTPGNTIWCEMWICPNEDPKYVVVQRAPLHNPVFCQSDGVWMIPAPNSKEN